MHPEAVIEPVRSLRAEVAYAMAAHVENDHSLASALAIHEEWSAGYYSRLLINAELLATARVDDFGMAEPALPLREAVVRAVEAINPWSSIPPGFDRPVGSETRRAFVDLAYAYAAFHATSGALDRRAARRGAPEDEDPIVNA